MDRPITRSGRSHMTMFPLRKLTRVRSLDSFLWRDKRSGIRTIYPRWYRVTILLFSLRPKLICWVSCRVGMILTFLLFDKLPNRRIWYFPFPFRVECLFRRSRFTRRSDRRWVSKNGLTEIQWQGCSIRFALYQYWFCINSDRKTSCCG